MRVFSVSECYAKPGTYSADLVVIGGGERLSKACTLSLSQGHEVSLQAFLQEHRAAQCEEKNYDLTLTGNSTVPNQRFEDVAIAVSGLPEGWYVLSRNAIQVERGTPQSARLTVKAPCDAPLGSYEFSVRASLPNPEFYSEARLVHTIIQGQKILVNPSAQGAETFAACQEEETTAVVKIGNAGRQQDTFRLRLEGPSFAGLEADSVPIRPGQEESVKIRLRPTGQKAGMYPMVLKIEGTSFDFAAQKELQVRLDDCYGVQVTKLEGKESVCAEDAPVYSFRIFNDRPKEIALTATAKGLKGGLDSTKFSLAAGQEKVFTATIDASGIAKEGTSSRNDLAIDLLIDTSGSMAEANGSEAKIGIAKREIIKLVNSISGTYLGLRGFGQGKLCEPSVQLSAVQPLDIEEITKKVSSLEPGGKTPLGQALTASISDFPAGKKKAIIVVSDGKETCDASIDDAAARLADANVTVYAIGFAIDNDGRMELRSVASRTGGKYFDAQDSASLADVLHTISRELDITPSQKGRGVFTLKLDSERFSYEKDFPVEVSDCAAASMALPKLELCAGIAKEDSITLANLGTEKQELRILYQPSWISGPENVSLEPNSRQTVKIKASPGPDERAGTLEVRAISPKITLEERARISFLSNSACFGIDLVLPENSIDANFAVGKKYSLFIGNRSSVGQEVRLSSDNPYLRFANEKATVEAGSRKEVNFFVTPPYDLAESAVITITAATERGFKTSTSIHLIASPRAGFGQGIRVSGIGTIGSAAPDGNYDIMVGFALTNDSNIALELYHSGQPVRDFNGTVQLESTRIGPGKTIAGRLFVDLPKGQAAGKVIVPVSFETSQGTFTRNIEFTYSPAANKGAAVNAGQGVSVGSGFFSLANLSTGMLAGLVAIVILLIAFSAYRTVQSEMSAQSRKEQGAASGAGASSTPVRAASLPSQPSAPKKKSAKGKRK